MLVQAMVLMIHYKQNLLSHHLKCISLVIMIFEQQETSSFPVCLASIFFDFDVSVLGTSIVLYIHIVVD